jgi:microcompartment protein CcmK/EutM
MSSLLHFRCKDRRRTQRVLLNVPLAVHGLTDDGQKFCAHAVSISVSQHGASFELAQVVVAGQSLRLVNENSNRKVDCHVVNIARRRDGKVFVGVEFSSSEVNFWSMTFPLPGAKPMRRIGPSKVAT